MKVVGERRVKFGRAYYPCVCYCGQSVLVRSDKIKLKLTCTCENRPRAEVTHKDTHTSWRKMHDRCGADTTYHARARYAGRGITVCPRWNSFENFLADMGPRPPGMSLDRIDNDKGYSKANCRWADRKTQTVNSTHARIVEFKGRKMCLKDWAREYGIRYLTLWQRLDYGWDFERALTEPLRKWPSQKQQTLGET